MDERFKTLVIACLVVLGLVMVGLRAPAFASTPEVQSSLIVPSAVGLSDAAVGWIVGVTSGGYGSIIHTQDGGQTWVRQGSPSEIPDVDLYGVWAVDRENAWAVGVNQGGYGVILHTTDGGAHWVRQGSPAQIPDVGLTGVSAVDKNTAWVVGSPGVILHTRDGGQNWTQQTGGDVPNVTLESVYAVDDRNIWVCGGVSDGHGTILRTTNGGNTWQRPGYQQLPGDCYVITLYALDANTVWAVGHGSIMVHTADGGNTWENRSPYHSPDPYDANGVVALQPDTVWVARDNGTIYRSDDDGTHWTPQTSGATGYYLVRISALDHNNAWITGVLSVPGIQFGVILHTENGGATWNQQTAPVNTSWWGVSFVDGRYYLPQIVKDYSWRP